MPLPKPKKTLSDRNDEIRRASSFPAGHFGPSRLREDDEIAEIETNSLGLANVGRETCEFRRNVRDNIPGHDVTNNLFPPPVPKRPGPGATAEEIAEWNEHISSIPDEERAKHMGFPSNWFDRDGKLRR